MEKISNLQGLPNATNAVEKADKISLQSFKKSHHTFKLHVQPLEMVYVKDLTGYHHNWKNNLYGWTCSHAHNNPWAKSF